MYEKPWSPTHVWYREGSYPQTKPQVIHSTGGRGKSRHMVEPEVHVEDVAAALLERLGPLDTWKLEKLVYYVQAWHTTWRGRPLFPESVEAWDNGPVVLRLYNMHRGGYLLARLGRGESAVIPADSSPIIDFVCGYYGHMTGEQLKERSHSEPPWRDAFYGSGRNSVITEEAMRAFCSSLTDINEQAWFWTPEWQAGERDADDPTGGVAYDSDSDFLASL